MLNIIKADLFRILKGKGIYIIIILLFLLSLMSAYTVSPLNVGLNISGDTTENYGLSDEWLEKLYSVKSMSETRDILINHGHYEVDVAMLFIITICIIFLYSGSSICFML